LAPERASTWTNLGVLYDRVGHDGRALVCYERSLGLDPDQAEIRARAATLDHARQGRAQTLRGTQRPTWLQAPSLLAGSERLPSLDLAPLRTHLANEGLWGAPAVEGALERGVVLRFDPAGALVLRSTSLGPEDPTLAWLRDHASPATWPELEATLEPAPPLALEGPRGWSFDAVR
tara:strand:- start:48 stop:575 length:528 start_codon:yes stop_codon:yes gene_type:complete